MWNTINKAVSVVNGPLYRPIPSDGKGKNPRVLDQGIVASMDLMLTLPIKIFSCNGYDNIFFFRIFLENYRSYRCDPLDIFLFIPNDNSSCTEFNLV